MPKINVEIKMVSYLYCMKFSLFNNPKLVTKIKIRQTDWRANTQ